MREPLEGASGLWSVPPEAACTLKGVYGSRVYGPTGQGVYGSTGARGLRGQGVYGVKGYTGFLGRPGSLGAPDPARARRPLPGAAQGIWQLGFGN